MCLEWFHGGSHNAVYNSCVTLTRMLFRPLFIVNTTRWDRSGATHDSFTCVNILLSMKFSKIDNYVNNRNVVTQIKLCYKLLSCGVVV